METFKHHFYIIHKATVDKSELVLSVWGEQCHQIDDNKLRANSGRKRSILGGDIVNRIIAELLWSWVRDALIKSKLQGAKSGESKKSAE